MATIKVKRPHSLAPDQARAAVDKVAEKLSKDLDAQCEWEGSTLKFKRAGANGEVRLQPDNVDIEIKLGMLLTPLKGKIEQTIEEEIDKYLPA